MIGYSPILHTRIPFSSFLSFLFFSLEIICEERDEEGN